MKPMTQRAAWPKGIWRQCSKVRVLFREDEIILPASTITEWFLMVLIALFGAVAILPLMGSVPLFIGLLYSDDRNLFSLLGAGTIAALALCLVYDLWKGECVLLNWHGGTWLFGMAVWLNWAVLLDILLLGRARYVLRRVKANGGWILRFERRWPFGWRQLEFTAPLERIGPVGLRVAVNPYTNKPAEPPAMLVDFGERTPHSLELFNTDAMAVVERLRLWEQETR